MFFRLFNAVRVQIDLEGSRIFLWAPVLMASGIAGYFRLDEEPAKTAVACAAIAVLCAAPRAAFHGSRWCYAVAFILAGFSAGAVRTITVDHPAVTAGAGFADIAGWVERIEIRDDGSRRLTIRAAAIGDRYLRREVYRLRVVDRAARVTLSTGDYIAARARLFGLPGPVSPGAYDFARAGWFSGLAGGGYAVDGPDVVETALRPPAGIAARRAVAGLRRAIADRILQISPGAAGALIAALITGERSQLPVAMTENLRKAGLAHLLAISGLHMSLIAGSLFGLIRAALALPPALALRFPVKKLAAAVALCGAAFYLVLSGAGVATQRAFIMAAIAFIAIIAGRAAVSMRNVAVAALVIMTVRPESVLTPGFQMSFATVIALVAAYDRSVPRPGKRPGGSFSRIWVMCVFRYIGAVGATTLIAGAVTAPIAAFHFNRVSVFGLISNLVAVPVVALVVMPASLAAVIAMPLGLDRPALEVAAAGTTLVIEVADRVARLPGSSVTVASGGAIRIVAIVLGGLWFCLWTRRWRWLGIAPIAAALAFPDRGGRVDVLVDQTLRNIAIRNPDNRLAVMSARRSVYTVERWLKADGDPASPRAAAGRAGLACDPLGCSAELKGKVRLAYVGNAAILAEECARARILITPLHVARHRCPRPDVLISRRNRSDGAHSITITGKGYDVKTSKALRGRRPWTGSGQSE